jgi:uncharacterized phage-associated protein
MAYNVLDIANKIIRYVSTGEYGDSVTNMKLQKLLYYHQGYHLAYFGEPMFDDEIEAWMYGPVVPNVYNHYKGYGNSSLNYDDNAIELSEKEEKLFKEVMRVYGDYSAIGLMNLTHKEKPWKETPIGVGNVISTKSMEEFFKKKIK